jgi:hypothetical protein
MRLGVYGQAMSQPLICLPVAAEEIDPALGQEPAEHGIFAADVAFGVDWMNNEGKTIHYGASPITASS